SKRIAASAVLGVAKQSLVIDTKPAHYPDPPLTDRTPSRPKAALWMAGWLALMLIVAVAGRETTRELNVFQIMEVRSALGLLMLYPLVHLNGGLAAMRTMRPLPHLA